MSLTSFLDSPEARKKFKAAFQKPRLDLTTYRLLAPPQTINYGLVGTAFDYLLRFYYQHKFQKSIHRPWFVESTGFTLEGKDGRKAEKLILEARELSNQFIKDGLLSDDLLSSCLKLASLEVFYRSGHIDLFRTLKVDKHDVVDLKNLIQIFEYEKLQPLKHLELNPSFGTASDRIGGADADLIIDDTIIDIKCSKNLEIDRDDFNQVIGYYVLNSIDTKSKKRRPEIKKIGFYFARYGAYLYYSIDEIMVKGEFESFSKWFVRACKEL